MRCRQCYVFLTLMFLAAAAAFGRGRPETGDHGAPAGHESATKGKSRIDLITAFDPQGIYFPDIHGAGYTPDGRRLVIPAHDGIRVYSKGKWLAPEVPVHDYMGFSATAGGFYASGHPSPLSSYRNPLGLTRVSEDGSDLTPLAFSGELDFHLLAAGYYSQAVYLFNEEDQATLSAGLHYSLDQGGTWTRSRAEGLPGPVAQLAVHPRRAGTVAAVAAGGLFLSADYGNRFQPVMGTDKIGAAAFSPDGRYLLYAGPNLEALDLAGGSVSELPSCPISEADAAAFLAVSPASEQEIVVVSLRRNIFLSQDGGRSWKQIAREGLGL